MSISWEPSGLYTKRRVITLDAPGANVADFPVLLKLEDAEAIVNADMASKRYLITDWLGNVLPYEEEAYSEGGSYVNFETWTCVPDLYTSPSGDQNKVVVYYDYDPGSDQDDAANAWDTNFLFVGHMNDASGGAQDSTSYGNHFAQGSAPAYQQTGKVGFGQTFTSDYHYRNSAIVSGVPLTVSALVKPPDTATYYEVIALGDTNGLQSFELLLRGPTAGDPVSARTYAGTWDQAVTSSGFVAGTWQHVAAVFAATNDRRAYLNGGSKGTNNTNLTPSGLDNSRIGRLNFNSQSYFTYSGGLDEVRISNIARSDAWIKFEYHNIFEGDNELTWGDEETEEAPTGFGQVI